MKFKGIVVSALLTAGAGMTADVLADEGVRISGFVDLNLERLSTPQSSTSRISSGGLNASRLEFSGNEDLGDGNQAFFVHQMQFQADTGAGPTPRETYVGLKGGWGALSLGRQNTPSYWIAGYADPSWSADYSVVNSMQFFYAPYRENNSILYVTPVVSGFKGRFMATAGQEDGTKNGRVLSTGVEYRDGALFAGAVSDLKYLKNIYSSNIESARDNYFSLAYKFGAVEPTFIYHTYNGYYAYPPYVGFQSKGWDVQLGARWKIDELNNMFFSFVHKKDNNNVKLSDADGLLVGYGYKFSKRTNVYVNYGRIDIKNHPAVAYPLTFNSSGAAPDKGLQLGIRHAF
ncbi:porin [Undibacterium sp.]|uniref:porin n=1 Tax=Undibacterium sp. TaxID=1914977 RepID=UPI002B8B39A2|nr:porin [Undibacterium sp.]HTD03775.1 porin [Undibacterium sp.]